MFINLSNHPSDKWSDEQREAAMALSQSLVMPNAPKNTKAFIVDMAFPNIPPTATTQDVIDLAEKFYNNINKQGIAKQSAVHIMGEMTFCFTLVGLLQQQGFLCVASTSERNTIENLDGSKTIVFNFVQFRPYPRL
ncbi:MAG: hypothetical protein JNM36_04730 [Chitinophagales bacterium]|nr:hypothetical protein [Chitinophagales bacterium]